MTYDLKELYQIIEQEENLEDDIYDDDIIPCSYKITSYGIDFDVDGLVRRLIKGTIYVPEFQRNFVWRLSESSRFIESLLLGLPVPGIFLAKDEDGKLLVIDGQQRLLTLKFFYEGYFNPQPNATTRRVFKLTKVVNEFNGKTYVELPESARNNLDNCVIHATVVKQDSPSNDDTSIYHIFERLNSGGRKLTAQEIRSAVYRGELIDLLKELNSYISWRKIFGKVHDRMKDQELILRFFAVFEELDKYKKPMLEFLNKYCLKNRNLSEDKRFFLKNLFTRSTDLFVDAIGESVFRPSRALNVAVYESCMVSVAKRLLQVDSIATKEIQQAYERLMQDESFLELISKSTTDVNNITKRIQIAKKYFNVFPG